MSGGMYQGVADAYGSLAALKTGLGLKYRYSSSPAWGVVGTSAVYGVGSATAGIGQIPEAACHLKGFAYCWQAGTATSSGAVTIQFTVYKNANSGSSNRVFQTSHTSVVSNAGLNGGSTSVVDSGMDAFNGTTDYWTLVGIVTASTSVGVGFFNFSLYGTFD